MTKIRIDTLFFKVDISSATSMESFHGDLWNDVAEKTSILKNKIILPPIYFHTSNRWEFTKTGVSFIVGANSKKRRGAYCINQKEMVGIETLPLGHRHPLVALPMAGPALEAVSPRKIPVIWPWRGVARAMSRLASLRCCQARGSFLCDWPWSAFRGSSESPRKKTDASSQSNSAAVTRRE